MRWWRPQSYYDSGGWRGTWDKDGGGSLLNQGIHGLDILLYLCGNLKEVQAQARVKGHEGIEVEDYLHAMGRFASGAEAAIHATTCERGDDRTEIRVLGKKGRVVLVNYQLAPGTELWDGGGNVTEQIYVEGLVPPEFLSHGLVLALVLERFQQERESFFDK